MYKKMTKLIGSSLILLTLLPLSPAVFAVFNLQIPVGSQPQNIKVIILTLPGQNLDTSKTTYKSERKGGFFTFPGMSDQHGDIDWIAWKQDANGNLVSRERWPLRGGQWVQENLMLLEDDDGDSIESSYCSPSCEYPSSVKTKAGYWVPVVVLGALAIGLNSSDDDGGSANGQSGNGSSGNSGNSGSGNSSPEPSKVFYGRWIGAYSGPGNGSLDIMVDEQGGVTGVAGGPGAGSLSGSLDGNTGSIDFSGGGHRYIGLLGRMGNGSGNFFVNGSNLSGDWKLNSIW